MYFFVFFLVCSLVFTLETVFDYISKHLEARQKYSATGRIFNSLLGVWKCGQTRSFVGDTLLQMSFGTRNKWFLKVKV